MLPPKRNARRSAARPRPLPEGENFGGEVSSQSPPLNALCGYQPEWASRRLDARLANDLSPFRAFGPELRGTLFGCAGDRLEAERCHPLLHARQRDGLDDFAMKQRDDLFG